MVWDKDQSSFFDPPLSSSYFHWLGTSQTFPRQGELPNTLEDNLHPIHAVVSKSIDLASELEHRGLTPAIFTFSVVFSIKILAEGLDIKFSDSRQGLCIAAISEKLGIPHDLIKDYFNDYLVWNARKQQLEFIYGLRLDELRLLISPQQKTIASKTAFAHIMNCFSMSNPDGSTPKTTDFHSYRGAFTPQFYPRRYSLKDSLYEQRLDILLFLLSYVLLRYATSRPKVSYVEFSVGVSDLSQPHILHLLRSVSYTHLTLPTN